MSGVSSKCFSNGSYSLNAHVVVPNRSKSQVKVAL